MSCCREHECRCPWSPWIACSILVESKQITVSPGAEGVVPVTIFVSPLLCLLGCKLYVRVIDHEGREVARTDYLSCGTYVQPVRFVAPEREGEHKWRAEAWIRCPWDANEWCFSSDDFTVVVRAAPPPPPVPTPKPIPSWLIIIIIFAIAAIALLILALRR